MIASMFFITKINGQDYGRGLQFEESDLSADKREVLVRKLANAARLVLAAIHVERMEDKLIKKVKGGYKVVSEKTGRNLSKVLPSKAAAQKRLQQVEFFKHQGK